MKRLVVLGASGSIGTQTCNVVEHHRDEFEIVAISVGHNMQVLKEIVKQHSTITHVCVADEKDCVDIQKDYPSLVLYHGDEGLTKLAALDAYDIFVNAIVGFRGLVPTLCAIEHQKCIALANKESLVAGGVLVKKALAKYKVAMYPIDSEHSAIFQCLQGNQHREIDKLIVTASGGSFRDRKREELKHVSVKEALAHPNWNMGGRITIDSATMMNKGFEVIEAHYLFDIDYDHIEVIIHRESVIHSMVQYRDHAIIAQLGTADMRLPIQYALSYPERLIMYDATPFDFCAYPQLHFQKPDFTFYPLLELAYKVGKKGGNLGAVMNGADEQAVSLFLHGDIAFLDIERYVIRCVEHATFIEEPTLDDLLKSDAWAREYVNHMYKGGIA